MLRPKPQLNLQNAREYFREHLCVGDYYSEGQKIAGEWFGQAAFDLGLAGDVGEKEFLALCEGQHPQSGTWLTQRHNTIRRENGRLAANRRIFHDFTISPPKSVSIVALYQDPRIVELHHQAVRCTLGELEKLAETRVRKSKQNSERVTGNIVAALIEHDTSRELDPHLHTHCIVFNATFDPVEGRWKALQTGGMYRAQKFAENLYFHELSKGLRSLGYEITNNARNFEITLVPRNVIARFSKRHEQIDAEARRRVAEGYDGDAGELRTRIAHELRRRKIKNSTADELRSYWGSQLAPEEKYALENLRIAPAATVKPADLQAIIKWADEHGFARRSVVNDYELMSAALTRGRGETFDLAELTPTLEGKNYLWKKEPRRLASRELWDCEWEVIEKARRGICDRWSFHKQFKIDPSLSSEQARAVRRILANRDFITLFRGAAGTGKSHTLREIGRDVVANGDPLMVLASQSQQVRGLERDGLPAQTLAQALTTNQFPREAVVILDEAGQVSARDLRSLIRILDKVRGRLLLSGDTRQHGPVEAGDAMLAIELTTHLRPAVLRTIRRQDPKLARSAEERRFIRYYRAAVKAAADGQIADSFDRLDQLGCVRELPDMVRRTAVADEYLAALDRGGNPLVVAQTWEEVHAVNDAIRAALQNAGALGTGEAITTYQPIDRTEAQKRDARYYEAGQSAFFIKRYGRYAKGELYEIAGANERGISLVKDGRRSTVSYRYAKRIAVVTAKEMELAPGDRLQLKANGRSIEGTLNTCGSTLEPFISVGWFNIALDEPHHQLEIKHAPRCCYYSSLSSRSPSTTAWRTLLLEATGQALLLDQ